MRRAAKCVQLTVLNVVEALCLLLGILSARIIISLKLYQNNCSNGNDRIISIDHR